jgi:hypothetical protein
MFAFHETTRKRICRLGFFALCVGPTLATGLWIASHRMPGARGRTARALSETLDVHVKLADWRYPRPSTIRSAGLSLSDPVSGFMLAEIGHLEAKQGGAARVFTVGQVIVSAAELPALAAKIERWVAKLPPQTQAIAIDRLVIKAPNAGRELVLGPVRGRVDRDASGRARCHLMAQLAGQQAAASTIHLSLEPSAESGSASATVTLDARGAALPARVFAAVAPGFAGFGAEAQFVGAIRWTLDRPQPQGLVQGRLEQVDLASILPAGSPHALRGAATVELQEMRWRGPRIERLAGTVHADHGAVSRSLVAALIENYRCGGSDGIAAIDEPEMVALDLLAVRFELDASGLSFWGAFPPEGRLPAGCMAVSGSQPLLIQSPLEKWHLGLLVQTLAAPGVTWMPATGEAVDMAERLPMDRK